MAAFKCLFVIQLKVKKKKEESTAMLSNFTVYLKSTFNQEKMALISVTRREIY